MNTNTNKNTIVVRSRRVFWSETWTQQPTSWALKATTSHTLSRWAAFFVWKLSRWASFGVVVVFFCLLVSHMWGFSFLVVENCHGERHFKVFFCLLKTVAPGAVACLFSAKLSPHSVSDFQDCVLVEQLLTIDRGLCTSFVLDLCWLVHIIWYCIDIFFFIPKRLKIVFRHASVCSKLFWAKVYFSKV